MIYPELRGYLMGAVSPDDLAQFDAGFALLEAFEVDEYMTPFDTIIGEVSDQGDTAVVDNVRVTLVALLQSLMALHSVALVDEVLPLSMYVNICTVLLRLPTWADAESIRQTAVEGHGVGENNESIFSDICAIIMGRPAEEYLPYIHEVGDGFIEALKTIGKDEDELAGAEFEGLIRAYVGDYKQVRDKTIEPNLWADLALSAPGMFAIPFALHLQRFLIERNPLVAECIYPEQYARLAHELVAIATISEERLINALTVIRAHAGEIFSDLNQSSLLDAAVAKFFMEANRAST